MAQEQALGWVMCLIPRVTFALIVSTIVFEYSVRESESETTFVYLVPFLVVLERS